MAFAKLKLFLTIIILLAVPLAALADTIRLKDGSIIKGRITGFQDGVFTVAVGEGSRRREMNFNANDIESIEFESPLAAATPPTPVNMPEQRAEISQPPVRTETRNPPRVITTDNTSTARIEPAVNKPEPTAQVSTPPVASNNEPNISERKPLELEVKVLADNTSNGWTNSGWVVKKGQRIRITGTGEVSLGNDLRVSAAGTAETEVPDKLLPSVPTGALLAVIGDDNNDFIYIGNSREFIASRDGALFLGVNDGNLDDNSGAFSVKIEIFVD